MTSLPAEQPSDLVWGLPLRLLRGVVRATIYVGCGGFLLGFGRSAGLASFGAVVGLAGLLLHLCVGWHLHRRNDL